MKFQSMPVKRRSVKKGAFRTLFANVANRKKKQRAATATMSAGDIEGDVPNLGVARALMVILVIHVVAIAGIFFHSHWLDGREDGAAALADKPKEAEVSAAVIEDENMPKIRSGDSIYTVGSGETYEIIANRFGVEENDLRIANANTPLRAGKYLRIPPKKIVAVEPAEITAVRESENRAAPGPVLEVQEPALVETEAAARADARPVVARPAAEASAPSSSTRSYVVKPGDTFWAIASRHGCSVDAVMKANKISDPRRLRVGMSLTIPE